MITLIRKRSLVQVFAACAALLTQFTCAALPAAAAEPPFPPGTVSALDGAIEKWFAAYKAPGVVVGIWMPGRGAYVSAQGKANPATGEAMQVGDHLRIGSVTKTFTVTVLLQLVDQGKLGLDDPVGKYLAFVPNGGNITLRMLANMTAGLFNYTEDDAFTPKVLANPQREWTPRELVDVAFTHKPYFAPGTGFHYSNTNTVVLGMVIEQVTGKNIGDVFQAMSFVPLGLAATVWPTNSAMPSPFALGVTTGSDGKPIDSTGMSPSESFTAGQIVSTVEDLRIWIKACATGAQISPALQKERLAWVTLPPLTADPTYGLGIEYNHGWLGHNGSIAGYSSEAFYLPAQDATLVILMNSDIVTGKVGPAGALFRTLAAIVTPDNVPR